MSEPSAEEREMLLAELQSQADIRQPMTIRLKPEAKLLFTKQCAKMGLEPGIACRVVIELMIEHMRSGPDFIDTLQTLKNALKPLPRDTARSRK